jgi:hypothetical protein
MTRPGPSSVRTARFNTSRPRIASSMKPTTRASTRSCPSSTEAACTVARCFAPPTPVRPMRSICGDRVDGQSISAPGCSRHRYRRASPASRHPVLDRVPFWKIRTHRRSATGGAGAFNPSARCVARASSPGHESMRTSSFTPAINCRQIPMGCHYSRSSRRRASLCGVCQWTSASVGTSLQSISSV